MSINDVKNSIKHKGALAIIRHHGPIDVRHHKRTFLDRDCQHVVVHTRGRTISRTIPKRLYSKITALENDIAPPIEDGQFNTIVGLNAWNGEIVVVSTWLYGVTTLGIKISQVPIVTSASVWHTRLG